MRKSDLLSCTLASLAIVAVLGVPAAQYWFQSGARGGNSASFNNGASVQIQTVFQNVTGGSLGFWVGEELSNGAFIQAGYEIANSTGYYSSSCTNSSSSVFIRKGIPTWFWEYFTPGSANQSFCGGIGPDGSVGANGRFNTYSFMSSGHIWHIYLNGNQIGSVNLGASSSGANPPSAFAEYAGAGNNDYILQNVTFRNLSYYISNQSRMVSHAYAIVSYGKGSLTSLPNPYKVWEVDNLTDYFMVGSNIPQTASGTLWRFGYSLAAYSEYGNVIGSGNYSAYTSALLEAPNNVNISNGVREHFEGWKGTGEYAYNGNLSKVYVSLFSNVTETAVWQRQYYLNVTSDNASINGSGWYDAGNSVVLEPATNTIYGSAGSRLVFDGWSNGAAGYRDAFYIEGPMNVTGFWKRQYYVNAVSAYGNTTGSGWYDSGANATVAVSPSYITLGGSERIAFSSWSDGMRNASIVVRVGSPVYLNASFGNQYLVSLDALNAYGQQIHNATDYVVSGQMLRNGTGYLFSNRTYNIEYFSYKGTNITTNHKFAIHAPGTVSFDAPVYNVSIQTIDVFNQPINASVVVAFKNGSTINASTGSRGRLELENVPLGYVAGYAEYLGVRQGINVGYGESPNLTFVTPNLIAFIAVGIIIVVAVLLAAERHERRKGIPG